MKKNYILVVATLFIVLFSFFGCNHTQSNSQSYTDNCNQLNLKSVYTGLETAKAQKNIFGEEEFFVNDLANGKMTKTNFEDWSKNDFFKFAGRNQLLKKSNGKNYKIEQTNVAINFVFPNQQILKLDKKQVLFDSRVKKINATLQILNLDNESLAKENFDISFDNLFFVKQFNIKIKNSFEMKQDIKIIVSVNSYVSYNEATITDKEKLESLEKWLAISVVLIGK